MSAIRSALLNVAFYLGTAILALLCVIVSLWPDPRPVRFMFGLWSRWMVFIARAILGGDIEIRGLRHAPKGPGLIVSKHQSELDAAVLATVIPDFGAVAMQELDRYPLIGRIARKLGFVMVATEGDRAQQTPQVVAGARRVAEEGRPMLIYPEGELMQVGRQGRYRSGVWHMYSALGLPVYPVAHDLGLLWPRREWRKHAGAKTALEFLPPIPPGLDKAAFMAEIERRIETATNALIREHAAPERLAAITFDYETPPQGDAPQPDAPTHGARVEHA